MSAKARVVFRGLVQGVFFRDNARRRAKELGLTGWVRNRPDGAVEAVAEGERGDVEEFIRWCSHDQPRARVESVAVEWSEPTGDSVTFEVRG
ncbi:MAG: acylphosphatase [Methanobacteriota archaeon]